MYMLYCILSILPIIMINQKENKGKQNLGSFLSLPAHGWVGARATPFLAAHFAKRNTKFGGGKARAGKNSWWTFTLQPPSFLPARAIGFQNFQIGGGCRIRTCEGFRPPRFECGALNHLANPPLIKLIIISKYRNKKPFRL